MKLAYFADPVHSGGLIYDQLARGFAEIGYPLNKFMPGQSYDYVLIFNCITHNVQYTFDGIEQIKDRFAFIDTAEYGWWTHYPQYADKYYSAFAPLSYKAKYQPAHNQLLTFLEGKSYPYFLREYYKNVIYPDNYYPIDYPLYYKSHLFRPIDTYEQFIARPLDLYISWGTSHPTRSKLIETIQTLASKLNIDISVGHKIRQDIYFTNLENAKMTVSFDGYGSGSFRETESLVRCVLLKNHSCIIRRKPLIDNETAIYYTVYEDWVNEPIDGFNIGYPRFRSTDITDKILEAISRPKKLYEIYVAGYQHCMKYYTEAATAQYILDILKTHDWSKPTLSEVSYGHTG